MKRCVHFLPMYFRCVFGVLLLEPERPYGQRENHLDLNERHGIADTVSWPFLEPPPSILGNVVRVRWVGDEIPVGDVALRVLENVCPPHHGVVVDEAGEGIGWPGFTVVVQRDTRSMSVGFYLQSL